MVMRRRVRFWGAVQGVGFRPFAYGLAQELGLTGQVANTPQGAEVEIEGNPEVLDRFCERIQAELPRPGYVAGYESSAVAPQGDSQFVIRHSEQAGAKSALILPDIKPCERCIAEMHDPQDRRYRYPFTNCTHCGPRYSIITGLPYDRPNTSMSGFELCPDCRREYEDPTDRRFHAQPIACPVCGPHLEFCDSLGRPLTQKDEALKTAAELLKSGGILALKGVGGFHLMVDARNTEAVESLRARKRREFKPLAVMVLDMAMAHKYAEISEEAERVLLDLAAPIVILPSKGQLSPSVAPDNPNIGLMLPSSPLHILLMEELQFPIVATSGNLSDEPICIDNTEAIDRLSQIADGYLIHDRPIVRPIDDSVCRPLGEGITILRRARGFAPLPFPLKGAKPGLVAYGAHMKGSVAVSGDDQIVVGQHVGDLDHRLARERLAEEIRDLGELYESPQIRAVHDLHPDYASSAMAAESGMECQAVQHHLAHAASLAAEHQFLGEFLAIAWDGTGLGPDQTIWGGEFLEVRDTAVRRAAFLRPFCLPGGDSASRQGYRSALGVLFEIFGDTAEFDAIHLGGEREPAVKSLLRSHTACVRTTSAGRLFDAAAAIGAGILESRFEGDAAMRWEAMAVAGPVEAYPFRVCEQGGLLIADWEPMVLSMLVSEEDAGLKSARFHQTLAEMIASLALRLGAGVVGLTGGCFQNALLSRLSCTLLRKNGIDVMEHRVIPPNDGGIAFGQAASRILGWRLV